MSNETKPTAGPWFFDHKGNIWRRPVDELYEYGGTVAGDRPLATVNQGWWDEGQQGYPTEANARLIAAAPELLEALILLEAEMVLSGNEKSVDYGWKPAIEKTRAAIKKATGAE